MSINHNKYNRQNQLHHFRIASQPAGKTLRVFALENNCEILFSTALVKNIHTNFIEGTYTLQGALEALLKQTGLSVETTSKNVFLIRKQPRRDLPAKQGNPAPSPQPFKTPSINTEIEEITVTAQKRSELAYDIPMSITTLNADQIRSAQLSSFSSISHYVPELNVIAYAPGANLIYIRGISNLAGVSSMTGIYMDEAALSLHPQSEMDIHTIDIERIEVLRGPQGTLYGQGAMGGTVRFITQSPELNAVRFSTDLLLNTVDKGDFTRKINSVINLPIVEDSLAIRVAADYEDHGGWVDHPASGRKNVNDSVTTDLHVKTLWKPSENISVNAGYLYSDKNVGSITQGVDSDYHLVSPVFPEKTHAIEAETELSTLSVEYNTDDYSFLSASSYLNNSKTTPVPLFLGSLEQIRFINYHFNVFTQEFRLHSTETGSTVNWTAGLFYRQYEMDNYDSETTGTSNPVTKSSSQFRDNTSIAAFFDVSHKFSDRFLAGAGLRYFEEKKQQKNLPSNATHERKFDVLSWRLYSTYEITETIKTYASISTGFRSGGFNRESDDITPPYEDEEVISYELGSKMHFLDNSLSLEVALFYSQYKDMQDAVRNPPQPNVVINLGDANIKGFDWAITWLPTYNTEISFSGNIVDTEFSSVHVQTGTPSHLEGDPIDHIPDYSFQVFGKYNFQWSDDIHGFIRAGFTQQGKAHATDRSVKELGVGLEEAFGQSDRLSFLNAGLGWNWHHWSLELFSNNLLNEKGNFISTAYLFGPSRPEPRTVGIRLHYDY